MNRIIRESKPTDITDIMQVMAAAKKIMRSSGNMHQWGDGYPSEAVILSDMEKHGGYVIEEAGRIVAYFAFLPMAMSVLLIRRGYGKQILLHAIGAAKEHFDAKQIEIEAQTLLSDKVRSQRRFQFWVTILADV
jgi:hypothetical protein